MRTAAMRRARACGDPYSAGTGRENIDMLWDGKQTGMLGTEVQATTIERRVPRALPGVNAEACARKPSSHLR